MLYWATEHEKNGYEAWQISLLYVFVGRANLGVDHAQNLATEYKRWLCVLILLTKRNTTIR